MNLPNLQADKMLIDKISEKIALEINSSTLELDEQKIEDVAISILDSNSEYLDYIEQYTQNDPYEFLNKFGKEIMLRVSFIIFESDQLAS